MAGNAKQKDFFTVTSFICLSAGPTKFCVRLVIIYIPAPESAEIMFFRRRFEGLLKNITVLVFASISMSGNVLFNVKSMT
jgi:hypothetical protein